MSADNYYVIFKEDDGKFRGYMGFASMQETDEEVRKGSRHPMFEARTPNEAAAKAIQEGSEYGFHFANWSPHTEFDELKAKVRGIKKELELIKQQCRDKPHSIEDMLTQLISDIEIIGRS